MRDAIAKFPKLPPGGKVDGGKTVRHRLAAAGGSPIMPCGSAHLTLGDSARLVGGRRTDLSILSILGPRLRGGNA